MKLLYEKLIIATVGVWMVAGVFWPYLLFWMGAMFASGFVTGLYFAVKAAE